MTDHELPGFRLHKLEVLNWGTFDQRVWAFRPDNRNALLTGDIGSGKSTLVDAVTTLLMPAHRVAYNKAAGAETKERNLRSYVMGYYKSERNEQTGTSRPIGLRDRHSYSVLLATFTSPQQNAAVTLAQVFWFRDGSQTQPDRFFATAEMELGIVGDFTDFGNDMTKLKARLRKQDVRIHDSFPGYGKDFRRKLGIDSEQAMELFHQTVSMKSVGNLNDFVRSHMLEPFDAEEWTKRLVDHFEDLTKAHDAVTRARDQLAQLDPLLELCDRYDDQERRIVAGRTQRDGLKYYFASLKATLLEKRIGELTLSVQSEQLRLEHQEQQLSRLRDSKTSLELQRAGSGGNRISTIENEIRELEAKRDDQRRRFDRYRELLSGAGLPSVDTAEQFAARKQQVGDAADELDASTADLQNRITETSVELRDVNRQVTELQEELRSLQERRNNIPSRSLRVRDELCEQLGVGSDELPFAGELIRVRDDCPEWEGAAERLLRGFGLSLLVADEHYAAVSSWIDHEHLGTRLVYYRVPARIQSGPPAAAQRSLYAKLEIKDSPFADWLDKELAHRADLECVEDMTEFRRAPKAITRAGQIKGARGRHEKDDRHRIEDRANYVLGWDNEAKIQALLGEATGLQREQMGLRERDEDLNKEFASRQYLRSALSKLAEFSHFSELDWRSTAGHITELTEERRQLETQSDELQRLTAVLETTNDQIAEVEEVRSAAISAQGRLEGQRDDAEKQLATAHAVLAEPDYQRDHEAFAGIAERIGSKPPATPEECDKIRDGLADKLAKEIDTLSGAQRTISNQVTSRMESFRNAYPLETSEFDTSTRSAGEYRALRNRIAGDDLPRFESDFKTYLNTNTIRDIAGFHSQLNKQADLIKQRVETINRSLVDIDYNPGRFIRLEPHNTINTEIRDFRRDLRECTTGVLGEDSEQYSEKKFLQVKAIIERFRGRDGHTDADRNWTRRVTDVRNWFTFAASERWRDDDTEHENYTDSGGKSGGQKEKLAYTILAASLAYQFKLDWNGQKHKTFRFVVIDEAFGRGSDESTRFALDLFGRLGLQLLIVTPLQKIHVIEPYVAAVGFVDNQDGASSRLQTLTIEEYRQRRLTHAIPAAS
ncbi:SbcC/MukB-like Walker B domain-containing protein [Saccharopolyspora sp. NPDC049426]|uniref:ATP-binding protein n=1 Tax=Saccharopolyspora sp. NPDC049426 TaxID=3155652 RepID=UPI00343C369E